MSIMAEKKTEKCYQVPINYNSEDYDGSPNVWFERTFRFRNLTELSALYARERIRISKAQKEKEEFDKYW